ncbi:MAG: GntR family transcriptional regulator [Gammaproteobacteria bacterium]|nr:GntR family transcriptional regulator [Gammaproteobacteria bacterium]
MTTTRSPSESEFASEPKPQSVSATQRVYEELRHRIIRGTIAPGEKLKVESLKILLDTGTSPIREALSLLTSDQLVERIDQRGFRAATASLSHFQEILELRCRLEDIALRNSVQNGDSFWEEKLVLEHHRLTQISRKDTDLFEQQHQIFHRALIDACGSPILLKFCSQLYDLNIRYRFLAGKSVHYSKRNVAREHKNILEAVVKRDADQASNYLLKHYTTTGEFLSDQLNVSLANHAS